MLLRWLLWRAADCVPLWSLVIRSTRGGASYPHTTAGVGARGDTGAHSTGGSGGSRTGGRRLLHWGAGGLHPGATRSAASARRATQDEAGWAGNFSPGSACARRIRRLARSLTVEYVIACYICRQPCPTSGLPTGIHSSLHKSDLGA